MLTQAQQRSLQPVLLGILALGAGAVASRVSVEYGWIAMLGLGGCALAFVILLRPVIGLYLLAIAIPFEGVFMVGEGVTGVRLLGLYVAGAWALRKLYLRESWDHLVNARILSPAVFFVGMALVSAVWSEYPATDRRVLTLVSLFSLSMIVADLVRTTERLQRLLMCLIVGGVLTTLFMLREYFVDGFMKAGMNVGAGVNHVATLLVILIPVAFCLLRLASGTVWRFPALAYLALAPASVALTFSRGSYAMLAIALGWGCFQFSKESARRRFSLAVVGCLVGVALWIVVPWDSVLARSETGVDYVRGSFGLGDAEISLRGDHWRGAIDVFQDYPLIGVGYGGFDSHFLYDYQFRRNGQRAYGGPRSPHSSLFGVMAELGLIGLALWAWLHRAALRNLKRARSSLGSLRGSNSELWIVRALTVSLLLYVGYGLVSVTERQKLFWLILGLTEAATRLAFGATRRSTRCHEEERAPLAPA